MSDTSNGWWEWIALGVLFLIWFFFFIAVFPPSPHSDRPWLFIFVVSFIATVFTGGIIAAIIDFIKPIRDRPKTTSTSGNHSKTTFKIGDVKMKKSIDIVKEVFNDDATLRPYTTSDLYKFAISFILYTTGSMLLLYQSLSHNGGFVLLIILFPFIGFLILLLNYPYDLFILIGFIAFSIGYMHIVVAGLKEKYDDFEGRSSKYIILGHRLFVRILPVISLISPLLWYVLCYQGYTLLKPSDELRKWDINNIRVSLKHLQREYIGYFKSLITKKHVSEDVYNEVVKKIKKLKKGVAEDVYVFKLTEKGYKKLMLAVEMIKGHGLEIYAPIESAISTVTPIYNIEEIGKYAECPYCGSNIRETFYEYGGIVRCDKCGAFHHKECFEFYGRKCGSPTCKL